MIQNYNELNTLLNDDNVSKRLENAAVLAKKQPEPQPDRRYINNHIHTTYSFSPYSPTMAAYMAYSAGLCTAGLMDHDTISGAGEFLEAGKVLGLPVTVGLECRVDFSNTGLAGRRINNPDQDSIAYVAMHGIPHQKIDELDRFMAPYRKERNKRNRSMVESINRLTGAHGITIDFDADVVPLSQSHHGGSITERHLLFALARKIIAQKSKTLVSFLETSLGLQLSEKERNALNDPSNAFTDYSLLSILKKNFIGNMYEKATKECPDVTGYIGVAGEIGAITAYAYLGDVGESVTGDKKAQQFEDSYLDELFIELKQLGFNAVTYMPTRNTKEQLERLRALCSSHNLFQISGEDINSPTQSFICKAMENPDFENLIDSTWAIIGHEKEASKNIQHSMFSKESNSRFDTLEEKVSYFKEKGRL